MSLQRETSHARRASSESLATSASFVEKKHVTINTTLAQRQEGKIGPRRVSQPNDSIPMKWQFDEIHRIQEDYKRSGIDPGVFQDKISTDGKTMHYRTLSHPASYPKLSQTAKHQELRHRHSSSELNILKRRTSHNHYYGSRSVMTQFPHLLYDQYFIDPDEMIAQKNRLDEFELELELLRTPRSATSIFSSSPFSPGVFSSQPLTPLSSGSPSYSPSTPYSAFFPSVADNEEHLRMFPLDEERWQLLVQQQLENSIVGPGSYKSSVPSFPTHESTNKLSTAPYMNDHYASALQNSGNLARDQLPRTFQKESSSSQSEAPLRNLPQDPIGTRARKSGSPELPPPMESSSQPQFSFFARSPTTSFNKVSTSLNVDKTTISNDGRFGPFNSYSPIPFGSGEDYFSFLKNNRSSARQKFDRENNHELFSRGPLYSTPIHEQEQETMRAGSRSFTSRQPLQRFDDGWDSYEVRMDMDRTRHVRDFARSEVIPRPRFGSSFSSRTTAPQDSTLTRRSSESQINAAFRRANDHVETLNHHTKLDCIGGLSAHMEALGIKGERRFHNGYNTLMNKNKMMDVTRNGLALGVM